MASSGSDSDEYFDAGSTRLDFDPVSPPRKVNEAVEDLDHGGDTVSGKGANDSGGIEQQHGSEQNAELVVKEAVTPRAYQLEMLEESLKRNLIVAMDTGSGKTHIAVLRMLYELNRMPAHKFMWFLAPTVSLCSQQFEYIQSQIAAVQVKFLSGADETDRWSDQSLWDAVLKNVKIVVSTYQILLDALDHGFVRMESLALIVFDEVHNCVGKSAGAKTMQCFYRPQKARGQPVPDILALTASPVFRSNPSSLLNIEMTMDAVAKTPTKYRSELRLQVKLPVLAQIHYKSSSAEVTDTAYPRSLLSLGQEFQGLRIADDPYVKSLMEDGTERSSRQLAKVLVNHKTWCQGQMKSLYTMSLRVYQELGQWATDFYIAEVVKKYMKVADDDDEIPAGNWDIVSAEKQYLSEALRRVKVKKHAVAGPNDLPRVSDKAAKLIQALLQEDPLTFSGIIFVQERAMVSVLAQLLSSHPYTKDRFRIATMVGISAHSSRDRFMGELIDLDSQKDTLSLFRAGVYNLVIATSVLEEGIDVPVCNLVLCFQKPANLKSFVQRRGRARHRDSKLLLLLDPNVDKIRDWEEAEKAMKRMYEDEMRALQKVLVIEDTEEPDHRQFRVESTGAILDMDNAVAHLYHFCATLPAGAYVDLRPEFICSRTGGAMIRAKVILPLSVNEAVRVAESSTAWMSEKNAIRDAAFNAYVALYKVGLVNDNLLPLMRHNELIDELSTAVETRASIVTIDEVMDIWSNVAKAWVSSYEGTGIVSQHILTVGDMDLTVYLPMAVPTVPPFQVYRDAKTELTVTPGPSINTPQPRSLPTVTKETLSMLEAAFGHRFNVEQKQPVMLFSPNGSQAFPDPVNREHISESSPFAGLIRDTLDNNIAYIFQEWLDRKPHIDTVQHPCKGYENYPDDVPYLSLLSFPRRLDFLHKIPLGNRAISTKPYSYVLPASRCTVDPFPFTYVQVALLIPSIMRRYELYIIAEHLSTTILKDVGFTDLDLIVTAISASSANEESNYQRLEFLGDSVLKLCASVQLIAAYPLWHEGYLSAKKDRLVANSRLARAAVEVGLDKYIITKTFTGHKWRPLFVEDLVTSNSTNNKRQLSSKVLADVVEALLGASMLNGGIPKALACLRVFLPELDWQPLYSRQGALFQRVPPMGLPTTLHAVESLSGHEFTKKGLLIEALTHASFNASSLSSTSSSSLERLEFLGDSVLDFVIVSSMRKYAPDLTHVQMHLLRTALVNADFLAFVCMEWKVLQERGDVVEVPGSGTGYACSKHALEGDFRTTSTIISVPLWRFLRHASPKLAAEQKETMKRHEELRGDIVEAIEKGRKYPWALLARLQAAKWYSDVIESVLGAVWIDCGGKWDVVESVVEKMGVGTYLRRILNEDVRVRHPKEEIGIWAGQNVVKYVIWSQKDEGRGREEKKRLEYFCKVFIGDEEVVEVGGGVGKEEVKTRAAEVAVEMLEKGEIRLDEKME